MTYLLDIMWLVEKLENIRVELSVILSVKFLAEEKEYGLMEINETRTIVQNAEYVRNEARSPYVKGNEAPEFLQAKIEDEFYRYSQVMNDSSNPLERLELITNTENSVSYFESLIDKFNIFDNVTVKK